jgi:hypothetical protein
LGFLALAPAQFAGAEEVFRETHGVSCLPNGAGCTTFQGYIYVRRNGEAMSAPVSSSAGGSDTPLGERRLYLHLGAAESP